jgi:stage V sporulation protein D (sporulation-specific penicillin-binding protein)
MAVTPFIVNKIIDKNNKIVYYKSDKSNKRVISENVSKAISDILIEGVDGDGGAKNAAVAGYDIAAKTGTSQKRDIKNENLYVGSCVAFSVYEEAALSVIIAVDEPTCQNYYGSTVAAPYVGAFLSGALPYLGVDPSFTDEEEARRSVTVGNYIGLPLSEAKKEINKLGVSVTVIGDGEYVLAQSPSAMKKMLKENGKIVIYTGDETRKSVSVPKLEGMTATDAIKLLTDLSLNVCIDGVSDFGAGVGATVIKQSVSSGTLISVGETVTLTLRYLDKKE